MDIKKVGKVKKTGNRHAAEVSRQTGFPSPATHYLEPEIDLNKELIANKNATFYIRIEGNGMKEHQVLDGDVLIVDRSKNPRSGSLIIIVFEGEFKLIENSDKKNFPEALLWGVITYVIHKK